MFWKEPQINKKYELENEKNIKLRGNNTIGGCYYFYLYIANCCHIIALKAVHRTSTGSTVDKEYRSTSQVSPCFQSPSYYKPTQLIIQTV